MMYRTGSYERIARQLLASETALPAVFCTYDTERRRLLVGTQSMHRTASARRWRLFWRLKYIRA